MKPIRPKAPMPSSITVSEDGGAVTITRKWFSLVAFFLVFFCLFWDGFMIVWFGIAISQGQWLMALFGTLHAAVGVGLTYYTAALFLNRTVITVSGSVISVRHSPLPWRGQKELARADVTQVYCKEQVNHGNNGTTRTYEVHVLDRAEVTTKLLTGLPDPDQALYIEQEMEKHLGIRDVPVSGSYRRD